jgi:hypothetical protein
MPEGPAREQQLLVMAVPEAPVARDLVRQTEAAIHL